MVYLDLWIADADGQVVANGRPDRYPGAVGLDVSRSAWFQQAMATVSGDDFAVTDITLNSALDDAAVATYATAIRSEGRADGDKLGVLGIFFDWSPQAGDVVKGVGLSEEERAQCRVMLLDAEHRVLADATGRIDDQALTDLGPFGLTLPDACLTLPHCLTGPFHTTNYVVRI